MTWSRLLQSRAFLLVLLAAAALLIYTPSLKNDFVVWDDDSLVYQNPLVQQMTPKTVIGAFTSYDPELYVPLTIVSFQIEHALFGFRPFAFHLDNLLLHVAIAFLMMLFLEELGLRRSTAFLGALLFVVHPVNTETIAWVSARKDLLSTMFSLASILCYLRMRRDDDRRWFFLAFGFLLCALLSKPVAVVVPFVFVLLDWMRSERNKTLSDHSLTNGYRLSFFGLSMLFLLIGLYGKKRNLAALSLLQTLLLGIKSTIFSLGKFFWPASLSPIYLQTDAITLTLPQFFVPLLILLLIGIVTLWSLRRTRVIAFSLGFFLLFLIPSFSNFAKDRDIYIFSDRYIYLNQIGMLFLIGYGLDHLRMTFNRRTAIVWILAAPLSVTLAYAAHAQSLLWKDSETLYRDALSKNDRSVVMHYNLALLEHKRSDRAAALEEYQKALVIDPRYAKALSNLGVLYNEEGQTAKAEEELRLAIESDPRFPEPHNNIGTMLLDRGDVDGSIAEFRAAIALNERYAQAHINLANALGKKGLYEEGLLEYKRAFEIDPSALDASPEIRRELETWENEK